MPAYGSLTSSQLGELMRLGGPHETALKAIKDPDWRRVFDDLGPVEVVEHDDHLHVVPSAASEDRFWDLVHAWAETRRGVEPEYETSSRLDSLKLGGEYTKEELAVAIRLIGEKRLKARRLQREAPMTYQRARYLWQWFDSGAAGWDSERDKLTARPGFKWIKTPKGDRFTLVRSG